MSRLRFKSYNNSSNGLNKVIHWLQEEYNIVAKKLKKQGSSFKKKDDDLVIDWGCSKEQSGKLYQYNKFKEHHVPHSEFTTNKEDAAQWIAEGHKVLCRTLNNASGGKGIVVARKQEELVPAPIYVKYRNKVREFRIHVYGIDTYWVEKKKRKGIDIAEKLIRSHDNGYVFCRNFEKPANSMVLEIAACNAVGCLDLSFGAVDIGLSKNDDITVYEVNTAPGLDDTTAKWYASCIAVHFHAVPLHVGA